MKFLDLNGLKHLLTKIKTNFGIAVFESIRDSNIPFVTNHQIVNVNRAGNINVYDWFQKAPKGGILEVVFAGEVVGSYTYCNDGKISYLYQMQGTSNGFGTVNINFLKTNYNTYARLIKMDDRKLVVAEFVQNTEN